MSFFFFFNDTATTEIYTLSLHDALPIYSPRLSLTQSRRCARRAGPSAGRLLPLLLKTLQQVGNLASNQVTDFAEIFEVVAIGIRYIPLNDLALEIQRHRTLNLAPHPHDNVHSGN